MLFINLLFNKEIKPMKMSPALKMLLLLWPILYLGAIFLVFPLFAIATPIPLMAVIGLLLISHTTSKTRVIFWATIYTFIIGLMFFNIRIWNYVHSSYHDPVNQYSLSENLFRFGTFSIIAFLASIYAITRDKIIILKNFNQMILDSLDEAVITADINGRIYSLNNSAIKLLEINESTKDKCFPEMNVIEMFFDSKNRGKMLSKYIESFDLEDPKLELKIRNSPVLAKLKKIKNFNQDLMMIIIRP